MTIHSDAEIEQINQWNADTLIKMRAKAKADINQLTTIVDNHWMLDGWECDYYSKWIQLLNDFIEDTDSEEEGGSHVPTTY